MYLDLFERELIEFNSFSKCPIKFTAKNHERSEELNAFNISMMIERNSYEFIFELINTYADITPYSEYTITANEYNVEKVFELSKLVCKAMDLKYDIHFLICTHCYKVIEKHEEGIKEWHEYLDNWSSNCVLSCFESFSQAQQAYTRYTHCFERKILRHLKINYKEVLTDIINKNQQLKENHDKIKTMCDDLGVRLIKEYRVPKKEIYYFDWDKDCITM